MSVNTRLLALFRQLSKCGRSFSVGDVAFVDEGDLFNSLVESGLVGMSENAGLVELRVPLENQCPCDACKAGARPKCAAEFKRLSTPHKEYVLLKLKTFNAASLSGLIELAGEWLGMDAHAVLGCSNRSSGRRDSSFERHDRETYALVCPPERLEEALREYDEYARVRAGNEFFVPTCMIHAKETI